MKMSFIPGLDVCRRLFIEIIQPLLAEHYPCLPYAAALIGPGSEVLGFDTEMSMDHNWSPRVQLFLKEEDFHLAGALSELLRQQLPHSFLGFPVDSLTAANDPGSRVMTPREDGPVEHNITLFTLRSFFAQHMHWDIYQSLTPPDWLSNSSQAGKRNSQF